MRTLLSFVGFIAVIILFSLILGSYSDQKNAVKQSDTHFLKLAKDQIQKKVLPEKKQNQCPSESIIHNFAKKLPKKFSNDEEEMKKYRTLILQDESLKKIVIENNKCGAGDASWFANLFSDVGLKDKANKYHRIVLDFARKNNMSAIADLCNYDTVASKEEKLHFCKIVVDSTDPAIGDKFLAVFRLAQSYLETKQGNEFIRLCQKAGDLKDACFFSYGTWFPSVQKLAIKLHDEKKFKQALELYTKIASFDETGLVQGTIADMYLNGEGTKIDYATSIIWYKKALKRNHGDKFRSVIMNNMCVAYEMERDYVQAFKCYERAATMGYALSQMNVAKLYMQGRGTIQDYAKAYAWISVSVAQGLDRDRQADAEKVKNALNYELKNQDKTGAAVSCAEDLSRSYYKQYVLHEKP